MAFTTADDWIERFLATGCQIQVDIASMYPREGERTTPEAMAIWNEIRGHDNGEKWRAVEAAVRQIVGPIAGWEYFPGRRGGAL